MTIPQEFKDQLVYIDVPDKRSDAEILDSLTKYSPITSEKNVWAFWHSGLMKMPGWCQRNVISWVRMLGSGSKPWTVRVLDSVPDSPNFFLNYVSNDNLPPALNDGKMDGPYFGPHSADLLRGACLYEHGGVFMDVGILLIRHLDRICWNQLEDPNSPFQVSVPWMYGITMANHFVACRKGDPFVKKWHDLFVHLWKDRSNHEGLINNPLIAFAKDISFEDSRASNFHWDFKVSAQTVMEYITQVMCWMRLCLMEETVDYWLNHVLIFDVLQENWGAEATIGFHGAGEKMFKLLSLKRDIDPESEDYKEAYKLVWRLLAKSSMQKITHGKHLTNDVHLGVLWDENPEKDCEPGTFAELLRYGTLHLEQTRKEIEYVQAPKPPKTMQKGLLES